MRTFLLFFSWPGGAVWGNVGAMPLCGSIAVLFAVLFRDRIGRATSKWWRRHFGHADELAEIRDIASAAHRIAAATYRHTVGHDHPDAPGGGRDPQRRACP